MDETSPIPAPRIFSGRYELNHLIARGGMADVYRAHDRLLDRPVALKVLFPELSIDRTFVERFRREAQAAANLSHPNIVPVFDWGEDAGTYFIVMEFVDGRPLSAILKSEGPLPADRAAAIAAPVAAALGYAHTHGVVHRDVKPGNVLITQEGQIKVTDFGIAQAVNTEGNLTQTGAVMGTATYFSPEQAEGLVVDPRTDIYSLGVVLFEMVSGRPPFLGATPVAVASKHVRDLPPAPREINPSVPPAFEAIILKAMAKNPDLRYATSEDLRADLVRFREGHEVLAGHDDRTAVLGATAATAMMGGTDLTQAVDAAGVMGATRTVPAQGDEPVGAGPRHNRTRTYVVILAVLLVLLVVFGLLLARSLGYLGSGNSSFSLPDVVSQPTAQATTTLQKDGLVVHVRDSAPSGTATKVNSQAPAAGKLVKKGDSVTLTVGAAGVTQTEVVPVLSGQTQSEAQTTLEDSHLTLGTVASQPSTSFDVGEVVTSSPVAGTKRPRGSAVAIVVSSGPPPRDTANPSTTTTTAPSTTTTAPPSSTTTTTAPPSSTTTTAPPSSTTTTAPPPSTTSTTAPPSSTTTTTS